MTRIFVLALVLALALSSVAFAEISDLKPEDDTRVFAKDSAIKVQVAKFHNRYGIDLVGHLYLPKDFDESKKYAAIALAGPFGSVKEQSSGLYAQEMAKFGYVALAFDPSFTGESSGVNNTRFLGSPEINTEDFSAAIDFLANLDFVDANKLGIIGICGWGGIAINAAAADTRIKATVASTMYDMTRVTANGYFDAGNNEKARHDMREALNAQRTLDYKNNSYARAGGVIDPLPEDAPQFVKDYYAYYKTPRGYHKNSVNSNEGWNTTAALPFMNFKFFEYAKEIRTPVLIIHGEKAHSRYFSEDAFKIMTEGSEFAANKELLIIPGASHVDLYDNFDKIPFAKIKTFFDDALLK